MAHIDSNKHSAHGVKGSWELEMEEIAIDLRVDLANDVGGLRHVEFEATACRHNL